MCDEADGALLRCLELAHESFLAGGLPVGSVITDGQGERVGEGRNRAYDPAGGTDRLQRTPIAAWPAVQAAAGERRLRLAEALLPVLSAYRSAGTAELPVWRWTIRMISSGS